MESRIHASLRLHRFTVALAAVVFTAVLAATVATGTAVAKPLVLGAAAPATPACPTDPCEAIGKTTGFQIRIGKLKNPFSAPSPGRVVAWSIKLAAPQQTQTDFFTGFFGGPPRARLSILKPINKKIKDGKPFYKLKSQGPVEELTPFLGTTTTFTLQQPLTVRKGQIVALTVPTWAPAFAVNLGDRVAWRGSRKKGKCTTREDIKAGRPHETAGQDRLYGCVFKTARLLYSATVVPKKKKPPADQQN
ncbi:MAG: hypothetical protein ACRDKH_06755 [Solirubrobacterales bacterium]